MDPEGTAIPRHSSRHRLYCHSSLKESLRTHVGIGPFCSCPAAPSPLQGRELIPLGSVPWAPLAGPRQGPGDERGQCLSQRDRVSNRGDATQEWGGVTPWAQGGARRPGNTPAPLFRVGKQPQDTSRSCRQQRSQQQGCEVTSTASAGPAEAQAVLQCPPAARDMYAHTGTPCEPLALLRSSRAPWPLIWELQSPSVGSGCTLCSSCPREILSPGMAEQALGPALAAGQCSHQDAGDAGKSRWGSLHPSFPPLAHQCSGKSSLMLTPSTLGDCTPAGFLPEIPFS